MKRYEGLGIMEMLIVLAILGFFMLIAIPGYFGLFSKEYVEDYAINLELVLKRAVDYAQQRQEPVAVCFALSKPCTAEGIMSYRQELEHPETAQDWKETLSNEQDEINNSAYWELIEALPMSEKVSLSSNFYQQRLMIRADGLGVFQPGSLYICRIQSQSEGFTGQRLVVARSGRIRREAMTQDEIHKHCEK